jgi:hypothetical protein
MIRIVPYQDFRGVWLYALWLAGKQIQSGYTSHAAAAARVRLCIASI